MDEKKPVLLVALGVGSSLSGVGESGADVTLESLLGPRLTDADLLLLCAFIACSGELPSVAVLAFGLLDALRLARDSGKVWNVSVGVGGVLMMDGGVGFEGLGGVRGGFALNVVRSFDRLVGEPEVSLVINRPLLLREDRGELDWLVLRPREIMLPSPCDRLGTGWTESMFSAWTTGDDVVNMPIRDGWDEMVPGRGTELVGVSGSPVQA
jgi:hypothetical protein